MAINTYPPPNRLSGVGGPAGLGAPIGSEYVQLDANTSYGNLVGIRWLKVGSGTTLGTDWLPDFGGRWISYAPTWSNVSMGSTYARYTQIGKFCSFTIDANLSAAPSGEILFTTPANMAWAHAHGQVELFPNWRWLAVWRRNTANQGIIYALDDANHYVPTGAASPEAWGSGDTLMVSGTFEIA